MNPFFSSFIEGLETRFPDDSSVMPMSEWVTTNTHLRQKPFSFKGYEFQRQIVDDLHPDLSVIKLSQVGLTECQSRKFFGFLKRHVGTSGIFALPNQPMRDRLSQTRVRTLIETNPIFNGPITEKPVRHKALYQVDLSFGYFTGNTEQEATSIPADILFADEVDLSDQQMLGLFQSRLQASKYKITQRFSTPTYYGFGIDAAYTASDQHEYQCKCPSCNHWQDPSFSRPFLHIPGLPDDIEDLSKLTQEHIDGLDLDGSFVKCEECDRPLDLGDPMYRQWVVKYPSRRARGYRVRPFSVTSITIPYIISQLQQYQRVDNVKGWYNTVLGEPYNDSNARISEEDIRACFEGPAIPSPRPQGGMFLGADVGQTCHVVVGTPDHILEFRQVPQGELLAFIQGRIATYGIVGGAIDLYPYTPLSESIRDQTHRIIMPIGYATTSNAVPMKEMKDEFNTVTHYVVNRTKAIDVVAKQTRTRHWRFSGYADYQSLLINHMRDMIRVERVDEPPVWNKINGNDHWLHALALHQAAVRIKAGVDFNSSVEVRTGVFLGAGNLLQDKPNVLYRGRDAGVLY